MGNGVSTPAAVQTSELWLIMLTLQPDERSELSVMRVIPLGLLRAVIYG